MDQNAYETPIGADGHRHSQAKSPDTHRPRRYFRLVVFALLAMTVIAVVVLPAIRVALIRSKSVVTDEQIGPFSYSDVRELWKLEQAMEFYKLKFGEFPPPPNREKIIEHVRRIYPNVGDPEAVLQTSGLDLDKLDSRESIVFWLGERPTELFAGLSFTVFSFDPKRLVDEDQDGWPEYACRHGDRFAIVDNEVVIESRELGRSMTREDIEREYCSR
jgi:hypothetical protein